VIFFRIVDNRELLRTPKMGHPIHLHGHKFWVLGSGSGPFPYNSVLDAPPPMINLVDPPYRDTMDLPPAGWAAIR
jgi:FtsP/CotA-like multicopper oxidase with cupredoxin domain